MPTPNRPPASAATRPPPHAPPSNPDALGWDAPIDDQGGFPDLPDGIARFEVLRFTRERAEHGKCGVCNIAILKLALRSDIDQSTATMDLKLPLHKLVMFKLWHFFTAIGQRKHGEDGPFVPDWNNVEGATGAVEIYHRTFTKKNGDPGTVLDVKRFLTPEEADIPF